MCHQILCVGFVLDVQNVKKKLHSQPHHNSSGLLNANYGGCVYQYRYVVKVWILLCFSGAMTCCEDIYEVFDCPIHDPRWTRWTSMLDEHVND